MAFHWLGKAIHTTSPWENGRQKVFIRRHSDPPMPGARFPFGTDADAAARHTYDAGFRRWRYTKMRHIVTEQVFSVTRHRDI